MRILGKPTVSFGTTPRSAHTNLPTCKHHPHIHVPRGLEDPPCSRRRPPPNPARSRLARRPRGCIYGFWLPITRRAIPCSLAQAQLLGPHRINRFLTAGSCEKTLAACLSPPGAARRDGPLTSRDEVVTRRCDDSRDDDANMTLFSRDEGGHRPQAGNDGLPHDGDMAEGRTGAGQGKGKK